MTGDELRERISASASPTGSADRRQSFGHPADPALAPRPTRSAGLAGTGSDRGGVTRSIGGGRCAGGGTVRSAAIAASDHAGPSRCAGRHVKLGRLHATLAAAADVGPKDFADLLLTPGVGARTVRSLVM